MVERWWGDYPKKNQLQKGVDQEELFFKTLLTAKLLRLSLFEAAKNSFNREISHTPRPKLQHMGGDVGGNKPRSTSPPIYTSNVQGQAFHTEDEMIDMNYF